MRLSNTAFASATSVMPSWCAKNARTTTPSDVAVASDSRAV
jgi:hypothetical protein